MALKERPSTQRRFCSRPGGLARSPRSQGVPTRTRGCPDCHNASCAPERADHRQHCGGHVPGADPINQPCNLMVTSTRASRPNTAAPLRQELYFTRRTGTLMVEFLVAMALVMGALLPLAYSFAKEKRLARALYQRAVAMEIVDGEIE